MRGKQIVDAYQGMFLLYAHSLFFVPILSVKGRLRICIKTKKGDINYEKKNGISSGSSNDSWSSNRMQRRRFYRKTNDSSRRRGGHLLRQQAEAHSQKQRRQILQITK